MVGSGTGASARRRAGDLQLALRLAAVLEDQLVVVAVAVDFEDQFLRERVDDRDAHAVQSARDLVALAAEFAAGVQDGQNDLRR
jgi:NAD(P)H-dependent FMN reductase